MVVGQDLSMTHLERAMECLSGLEEYYFVQDISLMDHENVELIFDEDDPIILFRYYEVPHELRDEGIDLGYIEEEKVACYWPGVGCYHKFGWRRDPRGRIVRWSKAVGLLIPGAVLQRGTCSSTGGYHRDESMYVALFGLWTCCSWTMVSLSLFSPRSRTAWLKSGSLGGHHWKWVVPLRMFLVALRS